MCRTIMLLSLKYVVLIAIGNLTKIILSICIKRCGLKQTLFRRKKLSLKLNFFAVSKNKEISTMTGNTDRTNKRIKQVQDFVRFPSHIEHRDINLKYLFVVYIVALKVGPGTSILLHKQISTCGPYLIVHHCTKYQSAEIVNN